MAATLAAGQTKITPAFSWKTLPVAFHSSSSASPFSAAQVAELSRYAMVTIEKYQNIAAVAPASTLAAPNYRSPGGLYTCQNGTDLSRCGCCAEDEIMAAARAIKAVNPAVVTIAYLNCQISYGWYTAARELAANAAWWLEGNGHDGPAGSTWKIVALDKPGAADWWQRTATNLTASGAIDGVFADGCMTHEGGSLSKARVEALYKAKHTMLKGLQPQLPGPVVCGSTGDFPPGVDAVQMEGWGLVRRGQTHFASEEIPALQKAVRAGVIFQAHGRAVCGQAKEIPSCCDAPPCNCTTPRPDYREPAVQTELAAFLVAMGNTSYFLCGSWEDTFSGGATASTWLPVYDLPLGEPLGDAVHDGASGIMRRSFASGTNATFNTKTETGTVKWAAPQPGSDTALLRLRREP